MGPTGQKHVLIFPSLQHVSHTPSGWDSVGVVSGWGSLVRSGTTSPLLSTDDSEFPSSQDWIELETHVPFPQSLNQP